MAIMGFPLIIPQVLLLMRISNTAFSDVIQAGLTSIVLMLVGLDIMIIALGGDLIPISLEGTNFL